MEKSKKRSDIERRETVGLRIWAKQKGNEEEAGREPEKGRSERRIQNNKKGVQVADEE